MEVILLATTPYPARIIAAAGRSCYSDKPTSELMQTLTDKAVDNQLKLIHPSCFEHVNFTFSIEGVSRVTTHQLVRHRIASFSQQSQRYVDVHKIWDHIVIPPKVGEVLEDEYMLSDTIKDEEMANAIRSYKYALSQLIDTLDKHKIPSEDIRYFVPNGVESNITVTMNLRELQHFLGLRRCARAQWEIREVADKMEECVRNACPGLARAVKLGPQCIQLGYCPEHKGCGRFPSIRGIFDYAIKGKIGECIDRFNEECRKEEEGE